MKYEYSEITIFLKRLFILDEQWKGGYNILVARASGRLSLATVRNWIDEVL